MKKLILFALFCLASLYAQPVYQRTASLSWADGSTFIAAPGGVHVTGRLLHVIVSWEGACGSVTVTSMFDQTGVNTYTQIGGYSSNGTSSCMSQWYAKNITGCTAGLGSCTDNTMNVQANLSGSVTRPGISFIEYSGASTTAPLDGTGIFAGVTANTTVTTSPFNTTATNTIVSCGVRSGASGAVAGTGYTIPSGGIDSTGKMSVMYKSPAYTSPQTGITASASNSGSSINALICAAFTDVAAGGGGGGSRRRVVIAQNRVNQ